MHTSSTGCSALLVCITLAQCLLRALLSSVAGGGGSAQRQMQGGGTPSQMPPAPCGGRAALPGRLFGDLKKLSWKAWLRGCLPQQPGLSLRPCESGMQGWRQCASGGGGCGGGGLAQGPCGRAQPSGATTHLDELLQCTEEACKCRKSGEGCVPCVACSPCPAFVNPKLAFPPSSSTRANSSSFSSQPPNTPWPHARRLQGFPWPLWQL